MRAERAHINSVLCQLQRTLDAQHTEISRLHRRNDIEDYRGERREDRHRVARRADEENAQAPAAEILLES